MAVIWIPNTPDTLVGADDLALDLLHLFAAGISQIDGFLENLMGLHVSHADISLPAVNVICAHHGMLVGPWRDSKLNAGVLFGECCKFLSQERTIDCQSNIGQVYSICILTDFMPRLLPAQSQ